MATIEIPKVRKESTVIMYVSLTDNGVTVDWTSLSEIKPFMYSDEQHCIAGKCTAEIATGAPETLIVRYPTTAPQFLGQNSLLIRCTYDGNEKSFDVPVLEFVDRSSEATGVTVIEDPELPVAIEVQDVDTSVLDDAIAAALDAAAKATAAAELVPLDILAQCQAAAEAAEAAAENCAPVIGDNGNWWIYDYDAGEYVDSGKPSRGIQGEQGIQGIQGIQGNTGSSVDYPYELVNNRTTDDATKGLSAAEGKRLGDDLSQLDQKVDDIEVQIGGQESNVVAGKYLDSAGAEVSDALWGYSSDYIPCVKTDVIDWSWGGVANESGPCLIIYNASKEVITYYGVKTDGNTSRSFTNNYAASAYIRISFFMANLSAVGVSINGTGVWSPKQEVEGIISRLDAADEELAALADTVETLQGKTGAESALMERKSIAEDSPYYFLQSDASYNGSHLDNIVRSVPAGRSFIFTTDAHWDNSNSKNCHFLIDYIKKRLGISTVVFGGDAIGNVQDSKYAGANVLAQYSEELFSAFGKNVLWVQGNHDTNVPGIPVWMPDTSYAVGRRVVNFENRGCYKCIVANSDATFDPSKWEAEDLFIDDDEINKRTINHLGSVVYDDAGIERMAAIISNPYDDAEKKLRYIILETFDYGFAAHIVFGGYGTYYLQFDWLAETLKSTPQGYTIIVCGHQVNSGSETSFYTQRLYQLIAAYLNAGSISITLRRANTSLTDSAEQDNYGYIHEFWGSSSPTVGKAKTFDFTGVTPCKLFCIGGHYHMDDAFLTRANTSTAANVQSLEYAATTPVAGDILTIFSNRNCWNRRYESDRATKYPNSMSPEMTVDTITEQSFDIVTITDGGQIICTRVGAGESRTFTFPALPQS